MTKNELLNINLPKLYEENLIKITPGLDNIPELPDWVNKGRKIEEYRKFQVLIVIESTKAMLKENSGELSPEELKQINEIIQKRIKEYNEL